jgi:pimeloyl-ACP methyl ester carboxylesterase
MNHMKIQLVPSVMLSLIVAAAATSTSFAQVSPPTGASPSMTELVRYGPTGLSLLSPYTRGKVPVVFIHGRWSNPSSWHRMIAALEGDHAIRGRFQFWTFGYSTGDPIPYSAYLLRSSVTAWAACSPR